MTTLPPGDWVDKKIRCNLSMLKVDRLGVLRFVKYF